MSEENLVIEKVDDVYMKVHCEPGLAFELSEYFTFSVPGAKHMPMFKNKMWDGKIRLYNPMSRSLYVGLRQYVEEFARQRSYTVSYTEPRDFADNQISLIEAQEWVASEKSLTMQPRDYQLEAVVHALRSKRALMISPTASGKSFMIYLICKYLKRRVLVVVPTTTLVHQMTSDFVEYGAKEAWIHKIYEGQEKINNKPITITTWQSIYKQPKGWFEKFEVVIGDEAHGFKSKSLTGIMSKLTTCEYKFGFTGTLDGTQTHKLVLEGLFGPERVVTTTSELIEQKHLAEFRIKAIVLNHTAEDRDKAKKYTYPEEIDFITGSEKRNKFLMNLVLSLKGNTLLLFKNIDHGTTLQNYISTKAKDRKVFYVDGDVKGDIRNDYRAQIETETNAIIVASLGTFSTGINIRNLHNVVFASPSKSRVKVLQSIGRGLRKSSIKTSAVLYDVADDLSYKSHRNFTLQHFGERIRMYNEEKFEYKIYNVQI